MPHERRAPADTRIGRVIVFLAVALAFSWTQWLAVIASQRGWIGARVSLHSLAIFGPFVAAIVVMIGAPDDRKRWLRSLFQWRIPPAALFVSVLLPPMILVCCAPRMQFPAMSTIATLFAGMFVIAGVGEESGWRGFLLPELRRSMGPMLASLIVAIVWFVWHLPLFWVAGATQQQLPVVSFAVGILSYSFLLTWLVEVSNDSALAAMLFHTSANVTFLLALPHYDRLSHAYLIAMAVCGAIAIVLLIRRESRPR